jgi:acyl transferase domain-containing protein
MTDAVAALYARGASLNWKGLDHGVVRRQVLLPTYPWQRRRYWIDAPTQRNQPGTATGHPLLGNRIKIAGGNE